MPSDAGRGRAAALIGWRSRERLSASVAVGLGVVGLRITGALPPQHDLTPAALVELGGIANLRPWLALEGDLRAGVELRRTTFDVPTSLESTWWEPTLAVRITPGPP